MNDFFMSNWSEPKNIVESTPITPVVSSSRSSLGGPTIAGIVVAVVVLVLAVGVTVLVVFLYINHRRKSKLLKSLKVESQKHILMPLVYMPHSVITHI